MAYLVLIAAPLIALAIDNMVSLWIILEVNFISFLFIIARYSEPKTTKPLVLYFLIQALMSLLLLLTLFLMALTPNEDLNLLITILLLVKLGAAPFHHWYISLFHTIENWSQLWLLSVWQKIIPILFLSLLYSLPMVMVAIGFCTLLASFTVLKQTNLKKIMAFSSLFNLGWLLASIFTSTFYPLMYLLVYGFVSGPLFLVLAECKNTKYNLAYNNTSQSFITLLFSLFLMISGIPPFIMFFMKIFILENILMLSKVGALVMLVSTITLIYTYLMFLFNALTLNKFTLNIDFMRLSNKISVISLAMFNMFFVFGWYNF